MSGALTSSTTTADAIPRHCTRCDYALAGLPAEGVCPECGTAYDGRFVVLRGWAIGASATVHSAGPVRAIVLAVFGLSGLWLQQIFSLPMNWAFGHARNVAINIAFIALTLVLIAAILRRRFAISGPPAQLWLSPVGYRLRGRSERHLFESPAGRAAGRVTLWLLTIGTLAAAVGLLVSLSWWSLLAITFAAIFVTLSIIVERERKRARIDIRIAPVAWPLAFRSWAKVATVRLIEIPKRTNRFEVRLEAAGDGHATFSTAGTTRVIVELNDAQSRRVVDQMNAWWSSAGQAGEPG